MMKYITTLMFLSFFGLTHATCLSPDGSETNLAQLIPEEDSRFAGFSALGFGFDNRVNAIRNEVFNYDRLDLTSRFFDSRDCSFIGSTESTTEEDSLDIGLGIQAGDIFSLDFAFGRNVTSSETTYTGYYACAYYREVATVSLSRSATVDEDLLRRNDANEFSSPDFFYDRYGTQYIDRISFGALYTVLIRFTTTQESLLDEWSASLDFDLAIADVVNISATYEQTNRETFERTETSITVQQTSRGFLLEETTLPDEEAFENLLNNPEDLIERIGANIERFDQTGSTLLDGENTAFGLDQTLDEVDSFLHNEFLVPISFTLNDFTSIAELDINNLQAIECETLARHLRRARDFRKELRGMADTLEIDARDVLDSFGIDVASSQGRAYSFALQIIHDDIVDILLNIDDYERQTPQYIIETPIERHSCGLGTASIDELRRRFRDVHDASDAETANEVFTGTTCTFEGIIVDDQMPSLISLFQHAGCPSDGSPGQVRNDVLRNLIEKSIDNRELVVIGGNVALAGDSDDFIQGVRFDEDRNVVGLGYVRRSIRDEIVSVNTDCTVIRVNDFLTTPEGDARVNDFACVTFPSCLLNNRASSRDVRKQLANGRIEVNLLSNDDFRFFLPREVTKIPPPPLVEPRKEVTVRERLCTVNQRCGDAEGTCYQDAECDQNLMCHPGTFKHPDYIYDNEALSFCVKFERRIARGINECRPDALCNDGEGSCQSNADCQGSLQCQSTRTVNTALYDLSVNQVFQSICVRPTSPFDPKDCRCCGRTSECDFPLQEGDGHCRSDGDCASGLSCIPETCGLFRAFHERNEFGHGDSCCVDLRGSQENLDQRGLVPIAEINTGSSATACSGECIKNPGCEYWVKSTEDDRCWLLNKGPGDIQVVSVSNRISFPRIRYGETPLGCPRGFVPTHGDNGNLNLYDGRLKCVKKPVDKVCGQGMKYTQKALQNAFDTSTVERDISVCRSRCRGCGAFLYNTDTSECSIFHGLDAVLSERDARAHHIVCIYDPDQAGERRVATNVCLNPRDGKASFTVATSGKILYAGLVRTHGSIQCLERKVESCPSHFTGFASVLQTPDHCHCCLHGSSCNRCPNGFFHSGIRTACSGRGEFRCHAIGEVHSSNSAPFACDSTERAQIVLDGGSQPIRFDTVQTQASGNVLTSFPGDLGNSNSIMSLRYLAPSNSNYVFADGEVCFDVYMIMDDSQITESPGDEPMCYCDNPAGGTANFNSIRCTNNEVTHCAANQECFAPAGVPLSQRTSACREPLVARQEIQYHSTECGSNDITTHPAVCPDGYALSSWEMVACDGGQAAKLIEKNARCIGHTWTDIFATSAGECVERLRDHPDCRNQKMFQWDERHDQRCGCFNGDPRHCRFESGRVHDDNTNVYEMFGFRVNYECIRVNQLEKEFKQSECTNPLDGAIAFECGVNQVLKEVRAVTSDCTGGDVRYDYVCSKIADRDEPKVNRYEILSSFTGSTGSLRCGPGDLLTGWGSGVSQCTQRREGYEALKGHQVACGWEASTNGEAPTIGGNSVNCGRICDSRSDCNSFTVCGETCYFTAEAYDAEVTRVCRDDRGSCTSYRNVNFVL